MATHIDLSEQLDPTAQLFGERLKTYRLKAGLTQGQLAEKTRTTGSYISSIERGRANPTLDLIVKLAEEVGAEAWDMIRPEPGSGAS